MSARSSATPIGLGSSFFSPSIAFVTTPFFGPLPAARSNSTTGTFRLTRCAAICAPITPAPSTAARRTLNRFIRCSVASLDTDPVLVAEERPQVAAHLQLLASVLGLQAQAVDLAVVRVEDVAAGPGVVVALLRVADDRHPEHRLVLALVGALVAGLVLLGRIEDLLDLAGENAARIADPNQRLLGLAIVVDRLPQAHRRGLRQREPGGAGERERCRHSRAARRAEPDCVCRA